MGSSKNSAYADYQDQICHNKAEIENNSSSIAKICNAGVVNLDIKMHVHELLDMPVIRID